MAGVPADELEDPPELTDEPLLAEPEVELALDELEPARPALDEPEPVALLVVEPEARPALDEPEPVALLLAEPEVELALVRESLAALEVVLLGTEAPTCTATDVKLPMVLGHEHWHVPVSPASLATAATAVATAAAALVTVLPVAVLVTEVPGVGEEPTELVTTGLLPAVAVTTDAGLDWAVFVASPAVDLTPLPVALPWRVRCAV